MATNQTITLTVDVQGKLDSLENGLKQAKATLDTLQAPQLVGKKADQSINELTTRIKTLREYTKGNKIELINEADFKKELSQVESGFQNLFNFIDLKSNKFELKHISSELDALKQAVKSYDDTFKSAGTDIQKQISKQEGKVSNLSQVYKDLTNTINELNDAQKNGQKSSFFTSDANLQSLYKQAEEYKKAIQEWRDMAYALRDDTSSSKYKKRDKTTPASDAMMANYEKNLPAYKELQKVLQQIATEEDKVRNKLSESASKANNDLKKAQTDLENLKAKLNELSTSSFEKVKQTLVSLQTSGEVHFSFDPSTLQNVEQLKAELDKIQGTDMTAVQNALNGVTTALQQGKTGAAGLRQEFQKNVDKAKQLQSELDTFKSRIQYFFGLSNAVNLFRRALTSTYQTVLDLDEVMTEAAVVTPNSISDMWAQLPEYTKRASELGVSIHDAYESMTIYYQQGLDTAEATQLSVETLKMARIAGLDAAEATDRMTNALRGFNMELNETNAERIDDVYNKLAAISASNVDEISTAMTKVASLANSANMEFETTAAFLAQMIETTRESAETAGTALKTVVARFSEVKSLYSEGELLGTDSEGEEIDVNKVSTALRTAGINLNEYLTGAKGLDDIFMELAAKWNDLDIIQQRYIATMAAGSRQQSRFIALMSDYDRTLELVNAAENSGGAANEMFEKTLDSLETKVARLKDAWQTFLMGIADNTAIKVVITALTGLINIVNKLTDWLPGLIGSFAKLGVAIGALRIGKNLFDKMFANLGRTFHGKGKEAGESLIAGIKSKLGKISLSDLWYKPAGTGDLVKKYGTELTAYTAAAGQATAAQEKLNAALLKQKAAEAGLQEARAGQVSTSGIVFTEADARRNLAEANREVTVASTEATAANEAQVAAQKALRLSDEQLATLNRVATTDEEKLIALHLMETGALEGLTDEQIKERIAEEAKNRTTEKGIVVILSSTAAKIADILALSNWTVVQNMGRKATELLNKAQGDSIKLFLASSLILAQVAVVVGVLVAAIVLLTKAIKNADPTQVLKSAEEEAKAASEAASEAADNYQSLSDSLDDLTGKYDSLEDLTTGTEEWNEAVQEINTSVLELMDSFDGLRISINDSGILQIENMDEVLEDYLNKSLDASSGSLSADINLQNAKDTVTIQDIQRLIENEESTDQAKEFALGMAGDAEVLAKYSEQIGEAELGTAEFAEALADAMGVTVYTTDEAIDALISFGQSLQQASNEVSSDLTGLVSDAISKAQLTGDSAKYARQFYSDTDMQTALSNNTVTSYSAIKDKAAYEEYYKERYGDNFVRVKANGTIKTTKGNANLKSSEALATYSGKLATDEASDALKKFVTALNKTTGQMGTILKKVYSDLEGGELTEKDLGYYTAYNHNTGEWQFAGEEYVKQLAEELYGSNYTDDQYKSLYADVSQAFESAAETFAHVNDDLTSKFGEDTSAREDVDKFFANVGDKVDFTADQKSALVDSLFDIFMQGGDISEFGNIFTEILEMADEADLDTVLNLLSSTDWTSQDAIDSTVDSLKDMGILLDGTFTTGIKDATNAIKNFDIDTLKEQIETLESVIDTTADNIENQTYTYTDDEYQAIKDLNGINQNDFVATGMDEWTYIGDSQTDLLSIISENVASILSEMTGDLQAQVDRGEAVEAFDLNTVKNVSGSEVSGAEWLEAISNGQLEIIHADEKAVDGESITTADLLNILSQNGLLTTEEETAAQSWTPEAFQAKVEEILQAFYNLAANQETLTDEQNRASQVAYSTQADSGNASAALETFAENTKGMDIGSEEYDAELNNLNKALDAVMQNTAGAEAAFEELKASMTAAGQSEQFVEQIAKALAIDTVKLNNNIDTLNATLDDYADSWDTVAVGSDEYNRMISKISNQAKQVFGNFATDEFVEANLSEFQALTEGGEAAEIAWNNIQAAISAAAVAAIQSNKDIDLVFKDNYNRSIQLSGVLDYLQNFQLEIGGTADFSAIFSALAQLVGDADTAAEYIRAVCGLQIEFQELNETRTMRVPTLDSNGNVTYTQIELPMYKATVTNTSSAGGSSGYGYRQPASTSSSSSSSSSSDSTETEKDWENPYDELYNLSEKLNETLREREKLEKRYDRLLKKRGTTAKEMVRNSLDQIASLEQELDTQQQILEGRAQQLAKVKYETYQDSDGNKTSYARLGVTKYASYDTSTGLLSIDWSAINRVTDEDKGAAIEAYISRLEELSESYEETEDRIEEIQDDVAEIREQGKEEYLELEQRIFDAIEEREQKVIDGLQEMSDTIDDTNSKVLDELQESIELSRQIRDNTDTEEEIADKEQRLAYLQRDTSGANDLEILQLQEDIEDARQNYQDSLIDQAIDQLAKDNEVAAEQRAEQIEIMQAQLDRAVENGAYWEEVDMLMRAAFNDDGTLNNNSEMVQLLGESEAFKGMSFFGKQNWINEMATQWLESQVGFSNWKIEQAENEGHMTLDNGTILNYDSTTGKWKDSMGNTYSNLSYDMQTDKYSGTNNNDGPKATSSSSSSKSSSGSSSSYGTLTWGRIVSAYNYINNGTWGNGDDRYTNGRRYGYTSAEIAEAQQLINLVYPTYLGGAGYTWDKARSIMGYKTGGLADFTGPAWLDGTKTKPEMVLSAKDTENFIALKDVLSEILTNGVNNQSGDSLTNGGDNYFDINIDADIGSDYDVDQLASRIKETIAQDATYRNVNLISWIR